MLPFAKAFEQLVSRAPGPVFPRARELYFRKYPLEAGEPEPFRTFLLEEEIREDEAGSLSIRAVSFAVVHWEAPQTDLCHYAAYLKRRWQLEPGDLERVEGQIWFREGGAYARFSTPAVVERSAASTTLVRAPADPVDPAGDPCSNR
jgi:hypothetical protein